MGKKVIKVANKKVEIGKSKLEIYEKNNRTIIKAGDKMSSTSVSYGLGSNNPSPIEIKILKNDNFRISNNMSNILLKMDNKDVEPGQSAEIDLDSKNQDLWLETIKVVNRSKSEEIFEIRIVEKEESDERSDLGDYLNQPYDASESSIKHFKDISEVADRSELATKIGSGQFRDVYKIDSSKIPIKQAKKGSIVKIANSRRGVRANRSEAQTWQSVRSTANRDLFCPITFVGPNHKYIIMKEAKNVGRLKTNIIEQLEKQIKSSLHLDSSSYEIKHPFRQSGWDIKKSNVGTYRNNPVLVDYPYGGKFSIEEDNIRNKFKEILAEN